MRSGINVQIIDGLPTVTASDREDLDELQSVLHQMHTTRVYRGGEPMASVVRFVHAARAAIALIDAGPVPGAEPVSDPEMPVEGSWITTEETARLLGIGPRAVRKRVATGTLQGRKAGGTLLINSKELV